MTITEFSGKDRLNISCFSNIYSIDMLNITSGSVIINLPNNQTIRLRNVQPSDMNYYHFMFAQEPQHSNSLKHGKLTSIIVSSSIGAFLFSLIMVYTFEARQYYLQRQADSKESLRLTRGNPTAITITNNLRHFEEGEEQWCPSPSMSSNSSIDNYSIDFHSSGSDIDSRNGAEKGSSGFVYQLDSKSSEGSTLDNIRCFNDNTTHQQVVSFSEWQSQWPPHQQVEYHHYSHNNSNNSDNNGEGSSIDSVNCSDFTIDLEEGVDEVNPPAVPESFFESNNGVGDYRGGDLNHQNCIDHSECDFDMV